MKETLRFEELLPYKLTRKLLLFMKMTVMLTFFSICNIYGLSTYAQSERISLNMKNAKIEDVLSAIEKQSGFEFFYNNKLIDVNQTINVRADQTKISDLLSEILVKQDLEYQVVGNRIILAKQASGSRRSNLNEGLQQIKITGTILDAANSEPLPGVNITVEGTTIGTISDANGNYSINVPGSKSVLVFSYLGYLVEKVIVGERAVVDIKLVADIKNLDEVVVIGFGTQKKGSVIGSVDRIETEKLKQPTRTISTSLAGQLAGVIAVQKSGEPGYDGASFWIRGVNTFTGNQSPLILVDNVERNLDDIDPEEIADFTILKDATATAVYGVRGANGVVLITTKKGSVSKPKINLKLESGFSDPLELPKFVDGPSYMKLQNEALVNSGKSKLFTQDQIDKTASGTDPYYYPNVNWFDELVQDWATSQRVNMNVSGGSEKVRYFVSGGFLNQNGMFKNFGGTSYDNNINVKRYNFRSNVDLNITKTTSLSVNLAAILEDRRFPGAATQEIFNKMMMIPPVWYPLKYKDETKVPGYPYDNSRNPYQLLARSGFTTEYHSTVQSNFTVVQDLSVITKGLQVKGLFSFDTYTEAKVKQIMTPRPYLIKPFGFDENGSPILTDEDGEYNYVDQEPSKDSYHDYLTREVEPPYNDRSIYMETSLIYNRVFDKHSIGALMLYNQNDKAFPSEKGVYESVPKRHQGLTGRVNYAFDEKYFVEYNFGYNGSENFAKGKRYGFFPSYAIGWVPTKEPFLEFMKPAIDYMKIRMSHGIVGNDGLNSRFVYLTRVETVSNTNVGFGTNNGFGYGHGDGVNITYYGNPDATWEEAAKTDIGLEMNFLKDFHLQMDVFYEKRSNIWVQLTKVPDIFGYGANPYANTGEMENRGFDGYLDYSKRIGKDFSLTLKGTFSYSTNKILENGEETRKYDYQSPIGQPYKRKFGYNALGLFIDEAEIKNSPDQTVLGGVPKPGDIKYEDVNDDGVINEFDRVYMGYSEIPEITYGLGANMVFKNIDFSFLLQGVDNVSFFAKPKAFPEENRGNVLTIIADSHWSPQNQDIHADFPRLGIGEQSNNYQNSTFWLRDGSYLRVKQIELGYSLPSLWMRKLGIESGRIYTNGLNLFTFSSFKWWDPESLSESGLYYPPQKIINIGLEIKF